MQSYLEVMGRKLDEIQAQHQQFYASRQDRVGRLRSQEHPGHLVKRWSSESHVPQQPAGLPPEGQEPLGAHCDEGQGQHGSPSGDCASGALRSSSSSQSGARRSLLFGDEPPQGGVAPVHRRTSPGKPTTTGVVAKSKEDLLAFNSTPPPMVSRQGVSSGGGLAAMAHATFAPADGPLTAAYRVQSRVAQVPSGSPSGSESTFMTQSVTPSAASSRLQSDTPGTSSTHMGPKGSTPLGASRLGATSSGRTSPMRPYAVYDASGVGSVPFTTPDSREGDYPLTASASSSSRGALHRSRGVAASLSPSPGLSAAQGHAAPSPSTVSGNSSLLAGHGPGADAAVSDDDDGSPYTLALPGRPFDGIDSEEEDEEGAQPAEASRISETLLAGGFPGPPAAGEASAGSIRRVLQSDGGGSTQLALLPAQPQTAAASTDPASRPQSRSGQRAPLVIASLETEEALRALLATPRFALSRSGTMGASVEVEGLEVPDDVLAALAKTDGMDLDAALGAAMAVRLREYAAHEESVSSSERPATQQQGLGGLAQTGHGRHVVLGPGALTAAPAAVPAAIVARGLDASVRSAGGGGAGGRTASVAGTASPGASIPRETAHPQPAERLAQPVDASIELDRVDMLSQTMEISTDGAGLRDSVACAAVAMAAQVAAAQQHPQPVLYSLAPKSSVPPDKAGRRNTLDGEGRRNTFDGGSRRNTVDGGSRRNTVDGCSALNKCLGESASQGSEQLHVRLHAAPGSAATAATAGGSLRSEFRPLSSSPSACMPGSGHGASGGLVAGRMSEGYPASGSPARLHRVAANAASPSASSAIRPGGDGDMVLYGSPSQKADAGPSLSVAASPYVPPSPPPGADPAPYMTSPTAPHPGSRLQRNSRRMDEEAIGGVQRDAVGVECGQTAQGDIAGPASGCASGRRPWSAASGAPSSSRRHLTQAVASGTSSGANSVHLDLSLTQAAAATGGVRSAGATAAPSPAVSQRQLRTQGSQHLPALPKQQSETQQAPPALEVPQLPAYSSFSLAGLSPPPRPVAKVASYDLGVDDVGRPLHSLPSPKDAAAVASPGQADTTAASADSSRASRTQLQPLGPPLAAFSRAAALAAAADVGMAAPPAAVERRPAGPAAGVRMAPVDGSAATLPGTGSVAGGPDTACLRMQGGGEALEDASAGVSEAFQPHDLRQGMGAIPAVVQEDNASDARHALLDHPELLQGQSPGPPSVASAAKLSQLKARRQQQWHSQHGLQDCPPLPSGASTPQPQLPGAQHHKEQGPEATHDHGGSAARGWSARPGTRPVSGYVAASGAPETAASRSPLAAAVGSPLLPDAVAEAIARAACSKEESAVSGELNLGHGISGLSVAIEAGQVKWAWQTDAKDKHAPGWLDNTGADAPPSPSGGSGGSGSPWASPAAAHAAVRDSGAEWALQQLPAPQWQRHGELPAGSHTQKEEGMRQQHADERPSVLQSRQPSGNLMDARRRSEYSVVEQQLALAGAGGLQHNYAVSAGGFPTQEQHQPRMPSATDGGGQPSSKAMALLRLKQQSIMRHNVQVSSVKESGSQPEVAQQQPQQSAPEFQPYQRSRASSASTLQTGPPQQKQPQRHLSATRSTPASELPEPKQVPRRWTQGDADDGEAAADDGAGSQAQPKPFLRRRSAKVQARKVDWSHVKPRTNSRNPDYYVDQNSPDAILKPRMSPITSPRVGVAKPPLNMNVGAGAKKPAAKPPLTPTEEDKAASAAPARRRISNIPAVPGPALPVGGVGEMRRGAGVGGSRVGGSGSGALSPLDDLLAHVNTLLRDFDKIVL